MMTTLTRWVLRHRRLVTISWVDITLVGFATVSKSTSSFSKKVSVPGREDFIANSRILALYHQGGCLASRWTTRSSSWLGCGRSTTRVA